MISPLMPSDILRDSWEGRVLKAATGLRFAVLHAIIVAEYPQALPFLLRSVFPGFIDIKLPQLFGYARIERSGAVTCLITRTRAELAGAAPRDRVPIYASNDEMCADMRRLADRLKLSDADRTEMFELIQKWVAEDLRIGPEGQVLH